MDLKGCCRCFNLRDGAKAIGITMLVLGSLGLIFSVGSTIYMAQQPEAENVYDVRVAATQIAVCILHLIFNSLLVHGAWKNSRGMVLAWLIYHGIGTGVQSVALSIILTFVLMSGVVWLVILTFGMVALNGVFWYWFVVVLHHYEEMHQENGFVYGRQTNGGEKHEI